jgi:hypothetical protein
MRPIDADSMKAEVESLDAESNNSTYESAMKDMLRFFITLIDNQPTIEPEVRHGRWIKQENGSNICSVCGVTKVSHLPFCGHCGAKMNVTNTNVCDKGGQEQ